MRRELDTSVDVMAGNQGPGHQPQPQQLSPADFRLMFYEQDPDLIHETEVLSGIVRRQSKYGSTASHINHFPNQKFISHIVQPNDTLQGLHLLLSHRLILTLLSFLLGLALRYSVTVSTMTRVFRTLDSHDSCWQTEQILRANRMYPTDSLFCKSVLSIPVPVHNSPATNSDLLSDPVRHHTPASSRHIQIKGQVHRQDDSQSQSRKGEPSPAVSHSPDSWSSLQMTDPSSISLTQLNGKDSPVRRKKRAVVVDSELKAAEETANDFLHRIDSSIAKTRDQVERKVHAAGVSYSFSENDLFNLNGQTGAGPSATSVTRSRSARFKNGTLPTLDSEIEYRNGDTEEQAACYIRPGDNKVRYSMKRLEREQDELFQL